MAEARSLELDTQLTFLTSWFCPFAQRTAICLEEKKVPFHYKEVSLRDPSTGLWYPLGKKPDWFLELNPLGQVPVLAYQEDTATPIRHAVYESLVCDEFLEEFAPTPPLLPPHPALRAKARIIIDHFDRQFTPLFYRILIRQDKEQQAELAKQLEAQCDWLEQQCDSAGPYFMGQHFSLVDCALVPWFVRSYVLQHFRGLQLPPERCTKLSRWMVSALQRPSVGATFKSPEAGASYKDSLLEHYVRYADGTANSTSAAKFG